MLNPDLDGYKSWFFVLVPAKPIHEGTPAIKCKVFATLADARAEIVNICFWSMFGLTKPPVYPEPVMGYELQSILESSGFEKIDLILLNDPVGES